VDAFSISVRVFFYFQELAEDPKTRKQSDLNSTAILSLANLLREVAVNNVSAHDDYPVHIFGRMVPKRFPQLTKKFIPDFGRALNKSLNESDSQKVQVFIRALGDVGHPSILPIFEPFLEGQTNATEFQRLLMVSSLDKLAVMYPKEAAAVLLKLYQNTGENHEIRCVAVSLLMATRPPANVLQAMAEFTNVEPDLHVSSMVQSAISTAAKLTGASNLEL
jgi:hypothetical protein